MPDRSVFHADDPGLLDAAYEELRLLASRLLRRERGNHTLQTTALVHEAWLRLGGASHPGEHDRYLALAARAMRRVLVDYERRRRRLKRGGGAATVLVDDPDELTPTFELGAVDVVALDEALGDLSALAPRQARVVELRFFSGLENGAVARILDVSERTVEREWVLAKTFLRGRLEGA